MSAGPEWIEDNVIITGHTTGQILIWNLQLKKFRETPELLPSISNSVNQSSDLSNAEIWDMITNDTEPSKSTIHHIFDLRAQHRSHQRKITALHITPSQRRLISADSSGAIQSWTVLLPL